MHKSVGREGLAPNPPNNLKSSQLLTRLFKIHADWRDKAMSIPPREFPGYVLAQVPDHVAPSLGVVDGEDLVASIGKVKHNVLFEALDDVMVLLLRHLVETLDTRDDRGHALGLDCSEGLLAEGIDFSDWREDKKDKVCDFACVEDVHEVPPDWNQVEALLKAVEAGSAVECQRLVQRYLRSQW